MTGEEFKRFRALQKLRTIDMAWMFDVDQRQISRWQNGTTPVPRSVELILRALGQGKINARWLVQNIPDPIPD